MRPAALKKGDNVIVISSSGKVEEGKVRLACKKLEAWGLNVKFGAHAFSVHNKMAGKDKDRASDLQAALDDDSIKAIFCSRGGYGLVRIIDAIDFSGFQKSPKWIVGFSDVTVLHNQVNGMGIATIHGPMPNSFASTPEITMDSLRNALFDKNYQLPNPFQGKEIVGGNLAIIYSLLGTNSDIDTKGKVLLLEDIGEYAYNIDRMFFALKKAGKFEGIEGLLIGQFSGIKEDDFGFSVKQIIDNCISEYDFLTYYDIHVGHVDDNRAVVLGA
ncbi:MAG: LD-carboxypeptidase [Flavobacteriales bacterium]